MEMKFSKLRKDERCKRLERSLKLTLLKKSTKPMNSEQTSLDFVSSINTNIQNLNCSTSTTQISQKKNENIFSSNCLQNVTSTNNNRYTIHNLPFKSSSSKESMMEKDHLDRKAATPLSDVNKFYIPCNTGFKTIKRDLLKSNSYSLPQTDKNSCLLSMNLEGPSKSIHYIQSNNENAENNANDNSNCSSSQLAISNIKRDKERTFFNWRIILNEDGQLLIKGMLDNGKVARSKPIIARLTATSIQSIYNHTYHLEGNIVDHRSELPEYVRGKFYSGFPDDWQNVYQLWVLYVSQGSKASFHWPTKITDSDDDITSVVTDLTFMCPKADEKQHYKADIILNAKGSTDPNVQVSSSSVCNKNWTGHTSKTKANNVSNFENHIPSSKNMSASKVTKKVQNREIRDKENHSENVNIDKLSALQTESTIKDFIQQDKLNIIVNNLLRRDCPEEYILKIIQMFDCLDDVFSYEIGMGKSNCESDYEDSVLYTDQIKDDKNKTITKKCSMPEISDVLPLEEYTDRNKCNRDVHKIPNKILQEQVEDYRIIESKNKNVQKCETKDSDELESKIYAGVPKVISEKILVEAKQDSLKWDKHKQGNKLSDVNPIAQSNVKLRKRSKKDRSQIVLSSSSDNDIENEERHFVHKDKRKCGVRKKTMIHNSASHHKEITDNIDPDSSVDITEDEDLRVEEKLSCAKLRNGTEINNLMYTRLRVVSSTDDEMELSKVEHKKFENAKGIIKHNAKKPRTVNDDTDCATYICNRTNDNNVESIHSSLQKHDTLRNRAMNTSKNMNNDKSNFLSPFSKRERSGDIHKSSSKARKVPRIYEFQSECDKAPEIVKSTSSKILPAHSDESISISKLKPVFLQHSEIEIADNLKESRKVVQAHNNIDNKALARTFDSSIQLSSMEKYTSLSTWTPRVVYDSKSTRGLGLVFEGKLLNEAGHVVHRKFVTDFIHRRLSSTLIETMNGEFYRLVGDLHDPKHVVPKEILKHCRNGCPSDINGFCKTWKSLLEGEVVTKQENATTADVSDVRKSLRGRTRYPSLNYWAGERVALKNGELSYTMGNDENCSMNMSNDSLSSKENNKFDEHTKNVEATVMNTTKVKRCAKLKKLRVANRDDNATSRLDDHKKYSMRQCSPVKKQNLMYTYYEGISHRDDILSDDQVSQL